MVEKDRCIEIVKIDIRDVDDALKKRGQKIAEGLRKYVFLMEVLRDKEMNILKGERGQQFQQTYTSFFGLFPRQKADARSQYYEAMQSYRDDPSFLRKCREKGNDGKVIAMVLQRLRHIQCRVELSFGSKLLSMINPNRPVWDKYVRENLCMPWVRGNSWDKRKDKAIAIYSCLCEKYKTFFNENNTVANEWIKRFDNSPIIKHQLEEAEAKKVVITDVKKVDFILWQIRR